MRRSPAGKTKPQPLPQHEIDFWNEVKSNPTSENLEKVVSRYINFVRSIAQKVYLCRSYQIAMAGLEFEDLVQWGVYALIKYAIPGYKVSKGYQFTTYAHRWLPEQMIRRVADSGPIYLPYHLRPLLYAVLQAAEAIRQEEGHIFPSAEAISAKTGIELAIVSELLVCQYPLSLDYIQAEGGEDRALLDKLASNDPLPGEIAEKNMLYLDALDLMDDLTLREWKIIEMRIMEGTTLQEAGDHLGMSREGVRTNQDKTLKKLRTRVESYNSL